MKATKKSQQADAQLLKNTPLPINHSQFNQINSLNELTNMSEQDIPYASKSQLSNSSKWREKKDLKNPFSIQRNSCPEEQEELADNHDETVAKIDSLNQEVIIQIAVEKVMKSYTAKFEERFCLIEQQQQKQLRMIQDLESSLHSKLESQYKKMTEKIKILFDNQTVLDQLVKKLQSTEIEELRVRLSSVEKK